MRSWKAGIVGGRGQGVFSFHFPALIMSKVHSTNHSKNIMSESQIDFSQSKSSKLPYYPLMLSALGSARILCPPSGIKDLKTQIWLRNVA